MKFLSDKVNLPAKQMQEGLAFGLVARLPSAMPVSRTRHAGPKTGSASEATFLLFEAAGEGSKELSSHHEHRRPSSSQF